MQENTINYKILMDNGVPSFLLYEEETNILCMRGKHEFKDTRSQ